MAKTIVFDCDDFQIGDALETLLKIKEHYPKFKITAFTIPFNISLLTGDLPFEKYQEWAKIVAEYDWIEIAPHGFGHIPSEMEIGKKEAIQLIKASENFLKQLGFKPVKVWKSPFWQTSKEAYEVLRDKKYVVAVDRNQTRPQIKNLKTYTFSWSIDEPFPSDEEIIKAHGHFYGTANDIKANLGNFFTIPADAEFLFVSEYIKKYGAET